MIRCSVSQKERMASKCFVIEHPVTHNILSVRQACSGRPLLVAFADKDTAKRFYSLYTSITAYSEPKMRCNILALAKQQRHQPRLQELRMDSLVRRCALNNLDMIVIAADVSQTVVVPDAAVDDYVFHLENTLMYY